MPAPLARAARAVRATLRPMLALAIPVVLVQVGMMLMGVVDTIMVGHLSAAALAAVALGNLYVFGVLMFGSGTLMALDPLVAQSVGAGDEEAVALAMQRGLLVAVALSVPSAVVLLAASPVLTLLRQPADVVPIAAAYARVSIVGIIPFLVFVVFRQSLQAMGRVAPIVITIVGSNVANAALNWVLIYGHLGVPRLGAVGSAWSTAASRLLMAAALLALTWRTLRRHLVPWREHTLRLGPLARMLVLGAPIGVQYTLEYGAFAVIALLMGWFGTTEMAAHQIAINLASLTFMVPLGISGAAAVLVGQAVGRADREGTRWSAWTALLCGAAFMSGTAVLFRAAPHALARLYSGDAPVVTLASLLIPIAGVFQVFDGLQAVGSGVLRGMGDTHAPMVVNVLGFWLVGMPLSLHLGFQAGGGPVGLWWGLVAGLAAVATFLVARIENRLRRGVERVR